MSLVEMIMPDTDDLRRYCFSSVVRTPAMKTPTLIWNISRRVTQKPKATGLLKKPRPISMCLSIGLDGWISS